MIHTYIVLLVACHRSWKLFCFLSWVIPFISCNNDTAIPQKVSKDQFIKSSKVGPLRKV